MMYFPLSIVREVIIVLLGRLITYISQVEFIFGNNCKNMLSNSFMMQRRQEKVI